MSIVADALDQFAGDFGASAHRGLLDVLQAFLDDNLDLLGRMIEAGMCTEDALHAATFVTCREIAKAVADDYSERVVVATAIATVARTMTQARS